MYAPVLVKSNKKSPSTTAKTTFNRLQLKIENLQRKIVDTRGECEKALILYHSDLDPIKVQLAELITQFILKIKELTRHPQVLSKKEHTLLQGMLKDDLNVLFKVVSDRQHIHDEVKDLYQKIYKKSIDESFKEEMENFKEELQKEGLSPDIDLSDLKPGDTSHDLLMKFMDALKKTQHEDNESESPPPKPKTKKELLKEEKARQLEAMQSRGISNIYKRLAKELHPDLEQDPKIRLEKDFLMKRVTEAYEKRDLIALLRLESEWLGYVDWNVESLNEETLKIYNGLLKEQIADLEKELYFVVLHPRYFEIQRYIQPEENPIESIEAAILDYTNIIHHYSKRIKEISGNNPIKVLKKRLVEIAEAEKNQLFIEQLMGTEFMGQFFTNHFE